MANVLRKLLLPGLLALTSFALPSVAEAASASADSGTMCLNSDYPRTRIVSVQECNSSSAQRWTISGESIYQSQYPGICLNSDYPRTRIVSAQGCNSSSAQRWIVSGETIYQSQYPGMCLATDYGSTRMVFVEECNSSGPRQHWTVQGEQISLTF